MSSNIVNKRTKYDLLRLMADRIAVPRTTLSGSMRIDSNRTGVIKLAIELKNS